MLQNQDLSYALEAHISTKMAMPKKNLFNKDEFLERGLRLDSARLFKVLNRLSVVLLFFFIVFIWSSSSIIISGSIAHVCVLSRKFSDHYCLSVGAETTSYDAPRILINDSTNLSMVDQSTVNSAESTDSDSTLSLINDSSNLSIVDQRTLNSAETTDSDAPLSLINDSTNLSILDQRTENSVHNNTLNTLDLSSKSPTTDDNNQISPTEKGTNGAKNATQKSLVLSPVNTLNTLVVSSQTPSTTDDNSQKSLIDNETSGAKNVTQKSPVLSPISNATPELVTPEVAENEFTKLVIREGVDQKTAEMEIYSRKAVETQIAQLRTYVSELKPSNCEGRGIYVYDLPPKFNTDLVAMCDEMMSWLGFCKYFTNDAMGEPIPDLGKGWYNTHQFSLEPIFHKRILKHSCRVENPEDAKIFYVPFYGALEMIRCHFTNIRCDAHNSSVVSKELIEWLGKQQPWKRNSGLDHVFVLGKITYDLRRDESAHWGTALLELDELKNPLKLLIERHPWTLTEVGMPYPTYFHPSSDEEIISWQSKVRKAKRRNLISFAGAMHSRWKNIRPILIDQCTSAPKACNFLNCSGDICVESTPVINLFAESEFCLQPPGDSPTRKSFFDSLIVGCIPVVFDPFTAHYQYPWHFPEDYKKYSVYIDQEAVKLSEINVIEKLVKIPLKERQAMRKYIIDELMPRLIYAKADAKLENYEDAITIALNNLHQMIISRLPPVGI